MSGQRNFASILFLLASGVAATAAASLPAPRLMVCYIEAPAAQTASLARILETYAARSRQGAGAPKIELLHEPERPNRMALVERWTILDAKTADRGAASLQAQIADKTEAPVDCRLGNALTPFIAATAGGFHVLMHVDVVPTGSTQASKLLLAQRSAVLAAAGGLGFEAAVQADRPNHFAVHEFWTSRAAYEAYASSRGGPGASPPTRTHQGRAIRRPLLCRRGLIVPKRQADWQKLRRRNESNCNWHRTYRIAPCLPSRPAENDAGSRGADRVRRFAILSTRRGKYR